MGLSSARVRAEMTARCVIFFIFVFGTFLSAAYGENVGEKSSVEKPTLTAGYSTTVFFDVDINDAKAATKVWTEMLIREKGIFGKSDTLFFPNLHSIEKAVRAKTVDVVIMRPEEFLEMKNKVSLVPVFAADYGKYFYHEFLIIVRADGGIKQFSDLKNRKLNVETGLNGAIPFVWLETLIMKEGFKQLKDFFLNIRDSQNTSKALLPVFFHQADAAIVNRSAFEVMVELNPQLGKDLRIITASPKLLTGIVCLRKDFYDTQKDAVYDILENMHREPRGRQILMLFHVNRLLPFKPSYIETVEALLRKHQDLEIKIAKRK